MTKNKFIKISVNTLDCKGIYFKDTGNIFQDKKELNKKDLEKINYNNNTFEIRLYPTRGGIKKKSFSTSNITGLNAVKNTITRRNELKDELQNTGTIKKQTFKSLDDIFQTYLQSKENILSKENIYSMTKTYNKWILKSLGNININLISTMDIQSIVNKILKQGLAPRTSQTIKQILRPVFNYAIDLDICIRNPAIKVWSGNIIGSYSSQQTKSFGLDIKAMAIDGVTKIVTNPILTIRDNEHTKFNITRTIPTITSTQSINDNKSETVENLVYKSFGIKIDVKPIISGINNDLELNINLQDILSNVGNKPETSDKLLIQKVIIKDNSTYLLSGFKKVLKVSSDNGVPLLKDIPILGYFFKWESKEDIEIMLQILIEIVDENIIL